LIGGDLNLTALLYIQSDGTLFVQSDHDLYEHARRELLSFAELTHRLDPIHVYAVQPVSLWQAASLGITARHILKFLRTHAAHPMPYELQQKIVDEMAKWGRLHLQKGGRERIALRGTGPQWEAVRQLPDVLQNALEVREDAIIFRLVDRAEIKRILTRVGFPVVDKVGYQSAPSLTFTLHGDSQLRDYQAEAVARFMDAAHDQSGVIVLPCGAGKTFVGIAALQRVGKHALILTPSESSAQQWKREFLSRTTLTDSEVRMYGPSDAPAPVTITTYQRVSTKNRAGRRVHLEKLTEHPWGIVVYDEVHMLPAPLFRLAADLQSARRLGLTATLVREDGAERDVFSLIGPKCFDVPWKQLERAGYLSAVKCVEVRVDLPAAERTLYGQVSLREQHRIAALNSNKMKVLEHLHRRHKGHSTLVIGHYLQSLKDAAEQLDCPLVTGQTPHAEREIWFEQFRTGVHRTIVLSRVANMAVDLPCASVAIQLSGLFGSRQEEAQRLGRLLRPQTAEGVFYTLVSKDTVEERQSQHRQMYLVEQGYQYEMIHSGELLTEGMMEDELVGMPEYR
jgi:DNA excision repair protein ERCC-3